MKTRQIKDIAFLALCMALSIIGLLVVIKDVGFIITQEKVSAQILHTNTVLGDKTQNKIKVRYFNKYQDRLSASLKKGPKESREMQQLLDNSTTNDYMWPTGSKNGSASELSIQQALYEIC